MSEIQLPIQPVADSILCSPYEEPDRHWLYDTRTGIPSKVQARREASYWYKSERTGSAQMSLLAEEEWVVRPWGSWERRQPRRLPALALATSGTMSR